MDSRRLTSARRSCSRQRWPFSRRILSSLSGAVLSRNSTKSSKTSASEASKSESFDESSHPESVRFATLREI